MPKDFHFMSWFVGVLYGICFVLIWDIIIALKKSK